MVSAKYRKTDETTEEKSRIEEYVKITKDDSGAKFTIEDGKYKIGPYKISWNYASEITITGKYVTMMEQQLKHMIYQVHKCL